MPRKPASNKGQAPKTPDEAEVFSRINLSVIKRADPTATEIVFSAGQCSLFEFDMTAKKWVKLEQEGPLMVFERSVSPHHAFLVLSQQKAKDELPEYILPVMKVTADHDANLISYTQDTRGGKPQTMRGIWIAEKEKCAELYKCLKGLVEKAVKAQKPSESKLPASFAQVNVMDMLAKAHQNFSVQKESPLPVDQRPAQLYAPGNRGTSAPPAAPVSRAAVVAAPAKARLPNRTVHASASAPNVARASSSATAAAPLLRQQIPAQLHPQQHPPQSAAMPTVRQQPNVLLHSSPIAIAHNTSSSSSGGRGVSAHTGHGLVTAGSAVYPVASAGGGALVLSSSLPTAPEAGVKSASLPGMTEAELRLQLLGQPSRAESTYNRQRSAPVTVAASQTRPAAMASRLPGIGIAVSGSPAVDSGEAGLGASPELPSGLAAPAGHWMSIGTAQPTAQLSSLGGAIPSPMPGFNRPRAQTLPLPVAAGIVPFSPTPAGGPPSTVTATSSAATAAAGPHVVRMKTHSQDGSQPLLMRPGEFGSSTAAGAATAAGGLVFGSGYTSGPSPVPVSAIGTNILGLLLGNSPSASPQHIASVSPERPSVSRVPLTREQFKIGLLQMAQDDNFLQTLYSAYLVSFRSAP